MTIDGGGPCVRCDRICGSIWIRRGSSYRRAVPRRSAGAPPTPSWHSPLLRGGPLRGERALMARVSRVQCGSGYRGGAWRHHPFARHLKCSCWWPAMAGGRGATASSRGDSVTVVLHTGHLPLAMTAVGLMDFSGEFALLFALHAVRLTRIGLNRFRPPALAPCNHGSLSLRRRVAPTTFARRFFNGSGGTSA